MQGPEGVGVGGGVGLSVALAGIHVGVWVAVGGGGVKVEVGGGGVGVEVKVGGKGVGVRVLVGVSVGVRASVRPVHTIRMSIASQDLTRMRYRNWGPDEGTIPGSLVSEPGCVNRPLRDLGHVTQVTSPEGMSLIGFLADLAV